MVSIWHGDADYVVRPINAAEGMEQWTDVPGIDRTADVSDTVAGYPHRVYNDVAGNPRVAPWTITGMGHGAPVDPGSGEAQCGTAGAYILDVSICSSYYIARFWGLDKGDGGGGGSSVMMVFDNEDANDEYVKAAAVRPRSARWRRITASRSAPAATASSIAACCRSTLRRFPDVPPLPPRR